MTKRTRYTVEQIIPMLREAEVELARGATVAQVCRKIGVTEPTYYRWRKEYGSLRMDQAKRLKELLKEALGKSCDPRPQASNCRYLREPGLMQ